MKVQISKSLIESIIRNENTQYIESTNEKVNSLLSYCVDELSRKSAFISLDNTILQPMNELITGAFTDNSNFVYFLGIDNAQLEINTLSATQFWKKFKERIIYAWQNRNPKKKKKRKKKNKDIEEKKLPEFNPEKYNLYTLCEDLQNTLASNLSVTSIVYRENNRLRIVGKDDFGSSVQIIIYPVFTDGEVYKYFVDKKKGFIKINNDLRVTALESKVNSVGESFIDLLKVFNVLYYNANRVLPNQIFMESLLCNCPNELFSENVYDSFTKILNYLTMSNIKNFKSIVNPNKDIFVDQLCGNSAYGYRKMINMLLDIKND